MYSQQKQFVNKVINTIHTAPKQFNVTIASSNGHTIPIQMELCSSKILSRMSSILVKHIKHIQNNHLCIDRRHKFSSSVFALQKKDYHSHFYEF
jgi:hypothetical protein